MAEPLRAVKGMNDILPPESARWEWFDDKVRALMHRYGYANVRTPIVEPTALFERGLGEVTDIVEKEMYSFEDAMNGDRLTLRPENTAGVVRAVNEHALVRDGGRRLWYTGPMFRHERPQKGRYRQFHQVGAEAIGYAGPDVDAELILMGRSLWRDLGLVVGRDVRLEINSLGQAEERGTHRKALVEHFSAHAGALDDDARRRLHTNPLRILDSKNPAMQGMVEAAPKLIDFLGASSLEHFDGVRRALDTVGLEYRVNPRLVRGLDYYNLSVFEWVTDRLGAQSALCAGGRYDTLIEQLGGKPTPAIGWGMGIERVLLLLHEIGVEVPGTPPDAYAIVPDDDVAPIALQACETLRRAGVAVQMQAATASGRAGIKAQFRRADATGARYALIFGADEVGRGEVGCKPLRDAGRPQRALALAEIDRWAIDLLA